MKLLAVLREKMGMVYSVGVSVGATQHPSALCRETISFSCLPDNVQALVDSTFSLSEICVMIRTLFLVNWKMLRRIL